jgi:predicted transport protein
MFQKIGHLGNGEYQIQIENDKDLGIMSLQNQLSDILPIF